MIRSFLGIVLILCLSACSNQDQSSASLMALASSQEVIGGTTEYLNSPYVTAGDRVYMVGHQDGSFPDLGWHIDGEMGGIWDHPIKLMDGFSIVIKDESNAWNLDAASNFQNLPIGNILTFAQEDLVAQRFQFVPDGVEGLIVELSVQNNAAQPRKLEIEFAGHVDLRPTWLSERENITDGTDEGAFDEDLNGFVVEDPQNDWSVAFAANQDATAVSSSAGVTRKGNGSDYTLSQQVELKAGETSFFQFFIAGSYESKANTLKSLGQLSSDPSGLLREKIETYETLAENHQLITDDPGLDQMFRWIKYNTQWLVRDVPEVGRGVSAGIPDYPWWFGTDGAYIIQGLVSAGLHEEALHTIDLIMNLSRNENGNGKIVHEVSSNGIVFNPGNLNTTPTFIHALWKAYEWTGDDRILAYYDDVKLGIMWIESKDEDGNGYPDGAGMMEIHGLDTEMIDVVAYLYQAYLAAANFAGVMNETELLRQYQDKAKTLKEKINTEWWVEEEASYADFRSNYEKFRETLIATRNRLDTLSGLSAEVQAKTKASIAHYLSLADEFEGNEELAPRVIHSNWVVNTPMEVGAAEPENATAAFETAKTFTSRFGMYVTGLDKKEEQEQATKWKAFSYVGAVMTLPTGVQAIGEARYGNSNASLAYLKMLENSFSYALPGSMYEVSPDFGMIAQGWNVYAVAVPVVDYFFGLQPEAHNEQITIKPQMPSAWNAAELKKIQVGANELSISFRREGGQEIYDISQRLDWQITFDGADHQVGTITSSK